MHFLSLRQDLVRQCTRANTQFREGISFGTPKLNAYITESLAVELINAGYLAEVLPNVRSATLARGAGDEPDALMTLQSGATATLEVKSTGPTSCNGRHLKTRRVRASFGSRLVPFARGPATHTSGYSKTQRRYLRAGLDWRSEREFARLTKGDAVCIQVPLLALLALNRVSP